MVQGVEFYTLALEPPYRDAIDPADYAHVFVFRYILVVIVCVACHICCCSFVVLAWRFVLSLLFVE